MRTTGLLCRCGPNRLNYDNLYPIAKRIWDCFYLNTHTVAETMKFLSKPSIDFAVDLSTEPLNLA